MILLPSLKNSPDEVRTLEKYLARVVGKEFSALTTPCYYPKWNTYVIDLQHFVGIKDEDIRHFFLGLDSSYIKDFKILNNKMTATIMISLLFYARAGHSHIVQLLYYMLSLRFYTNVHNKMFVSFCSTDVWEDAMIELSQKHLFKAQYGTSATIKYIADVEFNKNMSIISSKDMTEKQLLDSIYYTRSRIAQSLRSFAEKYYEISANKQRGGSNETAGEERQQNTDVIIEKVTSSITSYNQLDTKALNRSLLEAKIRNDIGTSIIKDMTDISHREHIKFLLILLNRLELINNWCQPNKKLNMIRKILSNKATFGKYNISDEIWKLSNELESLSFHKNSINKNVVISFITNYLVEYVKNRICN